MEKKRHGIVYDVTWEMGNIAKNVVIGFISIPFVTYKEKPKWCKCPKCGQFHHLAP